MTTSYLVEAAPSPARRRADANTARLRGLRLAKEEADRAYALANPPPPKTRKPRKKPEAV